MKSVLTIMFLSVLTWTTQAQEINELHDYLSEIDGSISMSIDMDIDDIFDGDLEGYHVEGDANRTQFSVVSDSEDDMDEVYHRVYNALLNSGLQKLVIDEDNDSPVYLFAEGTGVEVDKVHAFISGDDATLVFATAYGSFIITEE